MDDSLALRIQFDLATGEWVATWNQDDNVLFESRGDNIEAALAGLACQIGQELYDRFGKGEDDDDL